MAERDRGRIRRNELIVKHPTFWQRRSLLEKILFALITLAIFAIIVLAASLYFTAVVHRGYEQTCRYPEALTNDTQNTPNTHEPIVEEPNIAPAAVLIYPSQSAPTQKSVEDEVCLSTACVKAANKVMNLLDDSVDPCENFYEFACGKFLKETEIPDDKVTIDSFSIVRDLVQEQLREIINEDEKPGESKPFLLAKRLNKACLNREVIEERGKKPLSDLLESFGGWPVVKGEIWSEDTFDWVETIRKFRLYGLETGIVFSFAVTTDLKNSTGRVCDIDQASLGLSREYLIKGIENKYVQAYVDFMVDNAVIFGANREKAREELLESLEFETKLANISLPREERRNASALYNPMTVKELQEKYPFINWRDYINALLPQQVQIDENERVINSVPKFFEDIGAIIKNTSKRAMANYFLWRVVLSTSGTLTNELRQRKLAYFTTLYGQLKEEPRWKECVQFTSDELPISVGALYIRKYFTEDSRNAALEMVNNIRSEFMDILTKIDWMDGETRDFAKQKAKAITNHIGYPNELADESKLEEFYKELDVEADNLMLDKLRLTVFATNHYFGKLREPVNKTDWETHSKPALVNAFYSGLENSIQFPAAILQDRFFSAERPHYMNYAAIGQIIGHEITHGFDDQGRQFDADGNLADWWDQGTQEKFLEKAKCIIHQYGNLTDAKSGLSLNGINTQGENIADNGGLKEAYVAYQKRVVEKGAEGKLPGLKYTQSQLFWISAAQTWCAVARPDYNNNKITTGVHSPNEFRVIGPFSNQRDFAFDFNCPEGTKMNPAKKCEVW